MKPRSFVSIFLRPAPRLITTLLGLLAWSAPLDAQPAARTPDDDWRSLQALLVPAKTAGAARRTPVQLATARLQHADRLQQAAQQAKDFYTRHPTAPNAATARKLEVTATLESARLGRTTADAGALALATAYRADRSQLREHRFEVALAADRLSLIRRVGDKSPRDRPQDYEKLADDLRREFGSIPEIHGLYAGLAASLDFEAANRLATRLLEMKPSPATKAAAQAITARYGLLNRPLSLRLTGLDTKSFELPGAVTGSTPTILYVWTPGANATDPFGALDAVKARLPRDSRWIYLGLGVSAAQATAARAKAPFAGTHCIDDGGTRSAVAQRLKVRSSPTVFVLNRRGELTGYGRVDELPTLLTAAAASR